MDLFNELERVKLKFIAVCETLVDKQQLSEENFKEIRILLDSLDDHDEEYINRRLNDLTGGRLDLMFWE